MEAQSDRRMGEKMTDADRQKLCEWLRSASVGWSGSSVIEPKMAQAADEIERLAKKLAEVEERGEDRAKLCADLRLGVPDRPPRCCLTDRAAADEIERLVHKVYELQVKLYEAEASVGLQRDFVEADVHKLRRENERLAGEIDWLRKRINFAHIENTHSNTSG